MRNGSFEPKSSQGPRLNEFSTSAPPVASRTKAAAAKTNEARAPSIATRRPDNRRPIDPDAAIPAAATSGEKSTASANSEGKESH